MRRPGWKQMDASLRLRHTKLAACFGTVRDGAYPLLQTKRSSCRSCRMCPTACRAIWVIGNGSHFPSVAMVLFLILPDLAAAVSMHPPIYAAGGAYLRHATWNTVFWVRYCAGLSRQALSGRADLDFVLQLDFMWTGQSSTLHATAGHVHRALSLWSAALTAQMLQTVHCETKSACRWSLSAYQMIWQKFGE